MALYKDGKQIDQIHFGNRAISAVYKGAVLVWQAVRSCFASGFWINKKPWINDEGWKNK